MAATKKRSASRPKKGPARKAAAKKRTAKRAAPRKAAAKRSPARKAAAKKSTARKAAAKKSTARKAAAKKGAARRSSAKRAPARKAAAKRKGGAKAPRMQRALAAVKGVLDAVTAKSVLDAVTGAPGLIAETVGRVTHSSKPLGQKLRLREGMLATVLGAPGDAKALLGELPVGAGITTELGSGEPPFLLVFVRNQKELGRRIAELASRLTPKTLLWIAYPKQSSKVETDLNRDRGWEAATRAGFEVVAQVAVDATWAASRLIKRS